MGIRVDQETLKNMMQQAGFERCDYHNLSGGIERWVKRYDGPGNVQDSSVARTCGPAGGAEEGSARFTRR